MSTTRIPAPETTLRNLGDIAIAHRLSDALAIVDLSTGDEFTYRELAALTDGVIGLLADLGLSSGDRIGIWSLNRIEYLAAYFGIMRAGMSVVPISTKLPQDGFDHIVEDADLKLIFADADRAPRAAASVPTVNFDDDGPAGFAGHPRHEGTATVEVPLHDEAELLYTSGSTGRPKGVSLSHLGQIWALERLLKIKKDTPKRQLIAQPLFHMNGIFSVSGGLLSADTIYLQPRFDARAYAAALDEYRIEKLSAVPTMWSRALREKDEGRATLSSIRDLVLGSAPTSSKLLKKTASACPQANVSLSYGTTEAGPVVFGPHPDGLERPFGSLGYPLADVEVRLSGSAENDRGVLEMRSISLMREYVNLPERTAESVTDGWYHSGDLMRRDENGFYFFDGRSDDMFVCGGENIFPLEVESILERHPAVHQASVVPLDDEDRGQMPVAFIVPQVGAETTAEELKRFVLDNAQPHLHPRRIAFVPELPFAGTNKVDRATLIDRAEQLERDRAWESD
ncbi:class I adenylate-forming enzyme family protein [Microbacterium soli]